MEEKKTSIYENGLVWFGAGVSIAEILTGMALAPLGMKKGILAILLGHVIGCVLLFLAGVIGGRTGRSSMETVKLSFGKWGSVFFAILNVLQLVGWTGIMIYDGAISANGIKDVGVWIWCLVIGGLILIWILIGLTKLGIVNTIAMISLFILTIILSVIIFGDNEGSGLDESALSFGAAVELSVAMPLSWLPLISDYTRSAEKPVKASAVSALVYGLVSCWMYIIGMGASLFTAESDIAGVMVKAGLGIVGLLIIVFSTVTTTFLDAYSGGVSTKTIWGRISEKWAAVAVCVIGTVGAIVYPMDDITDFLYFIGSVFAPMIAVQIADFFLLKKDSFGKKLDIPTAVVWLIGFIIYRLLMKVDMPVGNTFPCMLITAVLEIICVKIMPRKEA